MTVSGVRSSWVTSARYARRCAVRRLEARAHRVERAGERAHVAWAPHREHGPTEIALLDAARGIDEIVHGSGEAIGCVAPDDGTMSRTPTTTAPPAMAPTADPMMPIVRPMTHRCRASADGERARQREQASDAPQEAAQPIPRHRTTAAGPWRRPGRACAAVRQRQSLPRHVPPPRRPRLARPATTAAAVERRRCETVPRRSARRRPRGRRLLVGQRRTHSGSAKR